MESTVAADHSPFEIESIYATGVPLSIGGLSFQSVRGVTCEPMDETGSLPEKAPWLAVSEICLLSWMLIDQRGFNKVDDPLMRLNAAVG